MMEKKADAILKVYNEADLTPQEWHIVGFHVYNKARHGTLANILAFHQGLDYYMNSPHFHNIAGQQAFDFGEFI
jgi:hypothetical protein